jgi:hypothetical protein
MENQGRGVISASSYKESQFASRSLSFWSYVKYFSLAVIIEIIALISFMPALAEQMMRHSGSVPQTEKEITSERVAFILHCPTVLIMWPLTILTNSYIVWLTPITQIVFWTCLFAYIGRRRSSPHTT